MADWTPPPRFDASAEAGPPPTLITVLSDGKVVLRQKHENAPETFRRVFWLNGADFDTWKAFYDAHGLITPFTILSYDDHGTPTQERTVRFASAWEWRQAGNDFYIVTLMFVLHR